MSLTPQTGLSTEVAERIEAGIDGVVIAMEQYHGIHLCHLVLPESTGARYLVGAQRSSDRPIVMQPLTYRCC